MQIQEHRQEATVRRALITDSRGDLLGEITTYNDEDLYRHLIVGARTVGSLREEKKNPEPAAN